MSLASDFATGIVAVLGNASFSTDWNFYSGEAVRVGEVAESNQAIAVVSLETYRPIRKFKSNARGTFIYKVYVSVPDRLDPATERSKFTDALVENFSDDGDILFAATTDSGTNLRDGAIEVGLDTLSFLEEADEKSGGEAWIEPRECFARISVTCWHKLPLG